MFQKTTPRAGLVTGVGERSERADERWHFWKRTLCAGQHRNRLLTRPIVLHTDKSTQECSVSDFQQQTSCTLR